MEKPPKDKTALDTAREVGRGIASIIPVAGGPLQVIFENIFSSPLEKRKQVWLEELAEVINEIQAKIDGFDPKKLVENEAFVTLTLQASQIALRNHQREKLDALHNVLLNSALPNAPEEDLQVIFLRLVDHLTPTHLRILDFLGEPSHWMKRHEVPNPGWSMGGLSNLVEHCFPELRGKQELYSQLFRDLQMEGLVAQGQFFNLSMSWDGLVAVRTSQLGKQFLKFVSKPA